MDHQSWFTHLFNTPFANVFCQTVCTTVGIVTLVAHEWSLVRQEFRMHFLTLKIMH